MNKLFIYSIFGISLFSLAGCTRAALNKTSSTIKIELPQKGSGKVGATSMPFPANKKVCYGVRVGGPGVPNSPNQCGFGFGLVGGFVEEGGLLTLDVPRGENRSFELVTHLVEPADTCPSWGEGFGATSAQLQATYLSGKTEGINLTETEQTVSIAINFPGETNNLIVAQGFSACASRLKGQLFSNGDVTDFLGNLLSASSETNESFYNSGITTDIYGIGFITAGGILNIGSATPVAIPPYVYSVTRKPDNGTLYGLVGDGKVVSIAISGSTASVSELDATTCPFSADNCKVPEWVQSISAGYGTELFSLDHAGTIYKVQTGDALVPTGETVPPQVTQVSYY